MSAERPTTWALAEQLREWAREHGRRGRYFRQLANKVENPPTGVRVELGANVIRFVGPEMLRAGGGSRRDTTG